MPAATINLSSKRAAHDLNAAVAKMRVEIGKADITAPQVVQELIRRYVEGGSR